MLFLPCQWCWWKKIFKIFLNPHFKNKVPLRQVGNHQSEALVLIYPWLLSTLSTHCWRDSVSLVMSVPWSSLSGTRCSLRCCLCTLQQPLFPATLAHHYSIDVLSASDGCFHPLASYKAGSFLFSTLSKTSSSSGGTYSIFYEVWAI